MGRARRTRKFAAMKRMISASDPRLKDKDRAPPKKNKDSQETKTTEAPATSSALFFQYNTALGPPFHILLDTNFINFSIKNKLDVLTSMMDCLYAKCVPYVTDCVMAELEKLGAKYRVALRIVKDERFVRLPCMHKGTYADDCLVNRVTQHKCYIVATCDKDLKRRIRKIPGVPIMYIAQHRYSIERMPDAYGAPRVWTIQIDHNKGFYIYCQKTIIARQQKFNVILFRFSMAKKDKHNPGQSRNSSVFKVANNSGKFNKQKGKPKEVSIKLKKVCNLRLLYCNDEKPK